MCFFNAHNLILCCLLVCAYNTIIFSRIDTNQYNTNKNSTWGRPELWPYTVRRYKTKKYAAKVQISIAAFIMVSTLNLSIKWIGILIVGNLLIILDYSKENFMFKSSYLLSDNPIAHWSSWTKNRFLQTFIYIWIWLLVLFAKGVAFFL